MNAFVLLSVGGSDDSEGGDDSEDGDDDPE